MSCQLSLSPRIACPVSCQLLNIPAHCMSFPFFLPRADDAVHVLSACYPHALHVLSASVSDIDLHARCTSFYPSLPPRIACPVSSLSARIGCQLRRTHCMSFQRALHVLSARNRSICIDRLQPKKSQPHCMSCQLRRVQAGDAVHGPLSPSPRIESESLSENHTR
jgi:hypothetical protein